MKSRFYHEGHHRKVARDIKDLLNSAQNDFLSSQTVQSTRAAGDAIESVIAEKFDSLLGNWSKEYSKDFARRSMADLAFTDIDGIYSIVDVKTHRVDTAFNMPNLTSVERLSRFYESDLNVFALVIVAYTVEGLRLRTADVIFTPIEFLNWNCLTIGALGWGQIQIANSNRINVHRTYSRKKWMLEFCDAMMGFYPNEISKINERIGRFEEVKQFWESKEDVWA